MFTILNSNLRRNRKILKSKPGQRDFIKHARVEKAPYVNFFIKHILVVFGKTPETAVIRYKLLYEHTKKFLLQR